MQQFPPDQSHRAGSGTKGEALADLAEEIERERPDLARAHGLSSAAMRAGDLVRGMRKSARLTQSELAKRLGVSQARISEIEVGLGVQGPTWDLMERVAKACGMRIAVQNAAEPDIRPLETKADKTAVAAG